MKKLIDISYYIKKKVIKTLIFKRFSNVLSYGDNNVMYFITTIVSNPANQGGKTVLVILFYFKQFK